MRGTLPVRAAWWPIFNGTGLMPDAAPAGLGLSYTPDEPVRPHLAARQLVRVRAAW
jgi:hypothetical protein